MKAIMTKYLGPTNTKGARIRASDGMGNTIIVPKDYATNLEGGHKRAIFALCDKMGWPHCYVFGWYKNSLVGMWKED